MMKACVVLAVFLVVAFVATAQCEDAEENINSKYSSFSQPFYVPPSLLHHLSENTNDDWYSLSMKVI